MPGGDDDESSISLVCDLVRRRETPMATGVVKFFNNERGYGFIKQDNAGRDVFVHITTVERAGLKSLTEGQRISFDVEPDKKGKGPKAVNLLVVSGRVLPTIQATNKGVSRGRIHRSTLPPDMIRRIASLSHMQLLDTIQLWKNCLRRLRDQRTPSERANARALLDAIGEEWSKRARAGFFEWPSTEAYPGRAGLDTRAWVPDGMLRCVGYKVCINGLNNNERRLILDQLFQGQLPPAFPPEYLNEWSDPGTASRLQKLAVTIAALTRNARRRLDSQIETAIMHWEHDLEYLYNEFYVGQFGFAWLLGKINKQS
jgi:cold shock CspA family protein